MNVSRSTHTADASGERIDQLAMMIGLVSMSRKRIRGSLFKSPAYVGLIGYTLTGVFVRYIQGKLIV
jgi:hypothetical protein